MKMKKLVANKPRQSFDESEFEDDQNDDDFATTEAACAHCRRKAHIAQLRAITANDSDIRMNGYLTKKRNSITGGWRKLYFVLQNRFLVSYKSRDIYEPIKDIIKLEPGMTIIPRAGLRFQIMANSYALYTLRCDSQQSFLEWITVLLDSFANARGGEATYERQFSQKENLQSSSIVPMMSSEVCLTVTTDKATAATDGGSRAVGPVMPARKSSETESINVPKLTLLSDDDALKSNALPQPVENEKRQENNENNDDKQTKTMHQSEYEGADHQRTEEVITQSFQFPDKSKLSSNISESSVPEQIIDIYSPVMDDQSFGTESGTSRSCSDLPTTHTAMHMINTSLSKSSMQVAMHSYTNVHEYVPLLPKPNNPCVAPPSPNITLRENEIFQEMPPVYATIDVRAKKKRRAQLQQLADGLPTSVKQSNSDDELPLSMGAGERSRTVDDSGCHIYEEIGNILSNEPLVSVPDPKNQNSGGSSSVYPLYEDVEQPVAVTDTQEELMTMGMDDDNRKTENVYEEILFPSPASGDALNRTESMLLPAGNKTTQSSTTKHDRSMVHTFWKVLRRAPFLGSSHSRKESQKDSGQQQSPEESIILLGKGRTMDGCSRKGQKKSLRKRIMKSLMFAR